jgi:hypothetical protein
MEVITEKGIMEELSEIADVSMRKIIAEELGYEYKEIVEFPYVFAILMMVSPLMVCDFFLHHFFFFFLYIFVYYLFCELMLFWIVILLRHTYLILGAFAWWFT